MYYVSLKGEIILKSVDINSFDFAPFKEIGDNWGLLTGQADGKFNSMTVSWGGVGVIWNKPSVFVFVRPQRYTYEFMEKGEYFSLSLMNQELHPKMTVFGKKSGRDCDKYAESGLTTAEYDGVTYCNEAETVFICRKRCASDLEHTSFTDSAIKDTFYSSGDKHRMYIGEITAILKK
ncbi:MAG: flavin reductase [Clostridia bacterium]|nr:flavin reductase [Clostridia bacterium]